MVCVRRKAGQRGFGLLGAVLGGAVMGGAMGAVAALGGAVAVGSIGLKLGVTSSLLIGAGAGMASYAVENGLQGKDIMLSGLTESLFSGMIQAGFTFFVGFAGGRLGAFGKVAKSNWGAFMKTWLSSSVKAHAMIGTYGGISTAFQSIIGNVPIQFLRMGTVANSTLAGWLSKGILVSLPGALLRKFIKTLFVL